MLGPSVEGWSFSELALREKSSQRFFYTVTFGPRTVPSTEWVQLLVYLDGKVIAPDAPSNLPPGLYGPPRLHREQRVPR
jgi:hypothetical protein